MKFDFLFKIIACGSVTQKSRGPPHDAGRSRGALKDEVTRLGNTVRSLTGEITGSGDTVCSVTGGIYGSGNTVRFLTCTNYGADIRSSPPAQRPGMLEERLGYVSSASAHSSRRLGRSWSAGRRVFSG